MLLFILLQWKLLFRPFHACSLSCCQVMLFWRHQAVSHSLSTKKLKFHNLSEHFWLLWRHLGLLIPHQYSQYIIKLCNNLIAFRLKLDKGHSIPNQILTLLDFHEIWHRHGLYKETFSHQNLADSFDLPLRYGHLNFILKYHFSLHILIKWP